MLEMNDLDSENSFNDTKVNGEALVSGKFLGSLKCNCVHLSSISNLLCFGCVMGRSGKL